MTSYGACCVPYVAPHACIAVTLRIVHFPLQVLGLKFDAERACKTCLSTMLRSTSSSYPWKQTKAQDRRHRPLGTTIHCLHAQASLARKAESLSLWWASKVAPILPPPEPPTFSKLVRMTWNLVCRPQMRFHLTKVEDFNCHFWKFWDHFGNVQTTFRAFECFGNSQGAKSRLQPK